MDNKKVPVMVMMMGIMIAGIIYAGKGVDMQNSVGPAEDQFHSLQEDYIVNNTKAERDSAPAGSALAKQQSEIAQTPSNLLKLKLVGVGKILTGIFILLFGIMSALVMMPYKLAAVIKDNK